MNEYLPDPASLPIFQPSRSADATPPASGNGHRRVGASALAGPIPSMPTAPPAVRPTEPDFPMAEATYPMLDLTALAIPGGPMVEPAEATPSQHLAPPTGDRRRPDAIDWKLVASLRAQASELLMTALGDERGQDLDADRERGRAIIQELLSSTAAERIHDGETPWSMAVQETLAKAVYDSLFGLGRLQPYVDDESNENVLVMGADPVWLEKADGLLERGELVANSEAEFIEFLQFLATRSESNPRSFSPASPTLHMRLDDGSRLAAAAWVTPYPVAVIRRHRLVRVWLDDLAARGMMSPAVTSLVKAAVRACWSVVVGGPQGGGKTTFLRACCNEIAPHERIGTFETEFELFLHEMRDLHPLTFPFEARQGSGETGLDGTRAGEYTLDQAMRDSFRLTLNRQIVGEVRGPEVWSMITAMEAGAGSLSTVHARDAASVMHRLTTCAMQSGMSKEVVVEKLADAIDLVIYIHCEVVPVSEGVWRKRRWVSEVLHVVRGEGPRGYATTQVVRPNPNGGAGLPTMLPDELRALTRYGFDIDGFLAEAAEAEGF